MSRIAWEDGLELDTETGEVFGVEASGREMLHYLARLHRESADREKGWTDRKAALGRAIVQQFDGQPGTENFPDITVKAQKNPSSLDRERWREFLDGAEMDRLDMEELLRRATGFDTKGLNDYLADPVGGCMKSSGVHARTTWALEEAPKRVER